MRLPISIQIRLKDKGLGIDKLDNTKKIIENKTKEERDQALVSRTEGDKCTRVSEDISLSRLSISKYVRLR